MGWRSPWPSTSLAVESSTVGLSPGVFSASDIHDPIREWTELLRPARRDEEVVLDPQASAFRPVATGLDREHHTFEDLGLDGLVGVRRLVRTCADAVQDRVRRLPGKAERVDALAHAPVERGETAARPGRADGLVVDRHQALLELAIARLQVAADEVLGVVGPVAVRAHPDREERGLALLHGRGG